MSLDVLTTSLASPAILFFVLGLSAAFLRSDLSFPESMAKAIAMYLLVAIGFKGGAQLAATGLTPTIATTIIVGIALGVITPLIAYALLRRTSPLGVLDAATVAAHYGSASLVTFLAASSFLAAQGPAPEPYLVTLLAVMESPAIVVGMVLARRAGGPRLVPVTVFAKPSPTAASCCSSAPWSSGTSPVRRGSLNWTA